MNPLLQFDLTLIKLLILTKCIFAVLLEATSGAILEVK